MFTRSLLPLEGRPRFPEVASTADAGSGAVLIGLRGTISLRVLLTWLRQNNLELLPYTHDGFEEMMQRPTMGVGFVFAHPEGRANAVIEVVAGDLSQTGFRVTDLACRADRPFCCKIVRFVSIDASGE